jgi:hypothetical protein
MIDNIKALERYEFINRAHGVEIVLNNLIGEPFKVYNVEHKAYIGKINNIEQLYYRFWGTMSKGGRVKVWNFQCLPWLVDNKRKFAKHLARTAEKLKGAFE